MKSLRKLLWIQLFLLSVLSTTTVLVELNPMSDNDQVQTTEVKEQMLVNN